MNEELRIRISKEVNNALDKAENIWSKVGPEFVLEKSIRTYASDSTIPSQIPGHPTITLGEPKVANFIAFVLDIRDSTKHLITAISGRVSQLERVLYETSAINAAGAIVIEHYKGGLTEYLGDGFLALFQVENEKEPRNVYKAYNAAKCCINDALPIVNEIIEERYKLPKLHVGIGLAYSKAIITIVGINDNLHPKAIGECVYRASKLSGGYDEINIDTPLKFLWPSSSDGILKFSPRKMKDVDGFLVKTDL